MCTRILYVDGKGEGVTGEPNVITGRNMDWTETTYTDLWAFPAGTERVGYVCSDQLVPFEWKSDYGSVIASGYKAGTTDGINTKGLVANLLFLTESEYPTSAGQGEKVISIGAWPQYLLDTCATVKEAVQKMEALEQENIRIVHLEIPGRPGVYSKLHLSVSDASGDSAIFQYKDRKLVTHHGKEYTVMTNSPFYDEQLAIYKYWQRKDGMQVLPGTNQSEDRFARASFYLSQVPTNQINDRRKAVATTFSIIRNASVPLGLVNPINPYQSSTIWSTVADQKHLVYYFSNSLSPSICWVNLQELDLTNGSDVRMIELENKYDLGGDITKEFKKAEPFEFTCKPAI